MPEIRLEKRVKRFGALKALHGTEMWMARDFAIPPINVTLLASCQIITDMTGGVIKG